MSGLGKRKHLATILDAGSRCPNLRPGIRFGEPRQLRLKQYLTWPPLKIEVQTKIGPEFCLNQKKLKTKQGLSQY